MHLPRSRALLVLLVAGVGLGALAPWHGWLHRLREALPIGDINHAYLVTMPRVDDPRIGRSRSLPVALKIVVASDATGFPGGIGKVVHDALFQDRPRFTFKVAFACAETDRSGRGHYANPESIWYDVFFGYYAIEVPRETWKRPFGYVLDGDRALADLEEVARIGKADWNHFSNQLYGVPADVVSAYDSVDLEALGIRPPARVLVGSRYWDLVEMRRVEVVGPCRATSDAEDFTPATLVGDLWRHVFGTFPRTEGCAQSFRGTTMRATYYMSYAEDRNVDTGEPVYVTYVFGGTVNADYPDEQENSRFLELQLSAIRGVMTQEGNLGFPAP
jgi:hypothetical protein